MRRLSTLLCLALVAVGLVAGADLSGAGGAGTPTMQANPASSPEPADVVVDNTDDATSRCEEANGAVGPAFVNPVEVALMLTGDNGQMQSDTVTPDAMGDWSQTYTGLPAGTYTVTGTCGLVAQSGQGAAPRAVAPFTYNPVTFVVTATVPVDPGATVTPAAPVAASPSFTG